MANATQSLGDFKGDHLSVKTAGARWDKTAAENTPLVQSALDYIGSLASGGTLLFPHGQGPIKINTVTVPSNCRIAGGGVIDIGVREAEDPDLAVGHGLYLNGVSNVTIEDVQITSEDATERTGVYGNIRLLDSSHIRIADCGFVGGVSTAVHAINTTDIEISGCSITDTWADAIHLSRACKRIRILGNSIYYVGDDGVGLIGYISDGGDPETLYGHIEDVVVANNTISNLTKSVGRGVGLYGVRGAVIEGNVINAPYSAGILVGGITGVDPTNATHYCRDLMIARNVIRDADLAGIYISYARNIDVIGNKILFGDMGEAVPDGISASFANRFVTVRGNSVEGSPSRGIIAYQVANNDARLLQELWTDFGDTPPTAMGVSDLRIENNRVRESAGLAITVERAILEDPSDNVIVRGNEVSLSGGGRDISVLGVNDSIVDGNICLAPLADGITLGTATRSTLLNNVVQNAAGYGIGVIGCEKTYVTGNYVAGCSQVGIYSGPGSRETFVTGNYADGNLADQDIVLDNSTYETSLKWANYPDGFTRPTPQSYWQVAPAFHNGINIGGYGGETIPNYSGDIPPNAGWGKIGSTYQDQVTGDFYVKVPGDPDPEWVLLSGIWTFLDSDTIQTVYGVQLFDPDDARPMKLLIKASDPSVQSTNGLLEIYKNDDTLICGLDPTGNLSIHTLYVDVTDDTEPTKAVIVPSAHASQPGQPLLDIAAEKFIVNYEGRFRSLSGRVGTGVLPETPGHLIVEAWLGTGGATEPVGTEDFTSETAALFKGDAIFDALTESLPLRLDASKKVAAGKIDLNAAEDVTQTGSAGSICTVAADGSITPVSASALWSALVSAVGASTMRSNLNAASSSHTHNIPTQGAHDHVGAVASDGDHDHGDTDPPTEP